MKKTPSLLDRITYNRASRLLNLSAPRAHAHSPSDKRCVEFITAHVAHRYGITLEQAAQNLRGLSANCYVRDNVTEWLTQKWHRMSEAEQNRAVAEVRTRARVRLETKALMEKAKVSTELRQPATGPRRLATNRGLF